MSTTATDAAASSSGSAHRARPAHRGPRQRRGVPGDLGHPPDGHARCGRQDPGQAAVERAGRRREDAEHGGRGDGRRDQQVGRHGHQAQPAAQQHDHRSAHELRRERDRKRLRQRAGHAPARHLRAQTGASRTSPPVASTESTKP